MTLKNICISAIQFSETVLFQIIQFSLNTVSISKTVLLQRIQFCISTQFSSVWPINRTLLGATTPGQSKPGSDGNEEVLSIPQSSSITETSPSDCLVSYPGHLLGVLPLRRSAVGVFYSPRRQGLIVVIVYYFQIETKKNTTLLLVELLAVTWVPCILRHHINCITCNYFAVYKQIINITHHDYCSMVIMETMQLNRKNSKTCMQIS